MHDQLKVAFIYGGQGLERDVSLMGADEMRPIIEKHFRCLPILIEKDGRWLLHGKNEVFPAKINGQGGFLAISDRSFTQVDCAFILLHGDHGEDGIVQGVLEGANIPYTGCKTKESAICRDKSILKSVAKELGIPTLPYITVRADEGAIDLGEEHIGYPMFVKPTCLGSSMGCSPVEEQSQLISALNTAFKISDRVIIERLLRPKRELECGYFATKGKYLFTNVGEIIVDGEFYDYNKKYGISKTKVDPKANAKRKTQEKIQEYSRRLVNRLGIRQMARIDFFLSGEEIYFNEINTIPGMTKDSIYPKMLESSGISRDDFVRMIILDTVSGA